MIINGNFICGRRIQHPLQPNISSTMCSVIGRIVPELAIEMSNDDDSKSWEKEQFATEFSRCSSLKDLTIVGSRKEARSWIEKKIQFKMQQ